MLDEAVTPVCKRAAGFLRFAAVFPGQGVNVAGIGREWSATQAWWEVVPAAEHALGEKVGDLLTSESERVGLRSAQLATFFLSLIAWTEARPMLPAPACVTGHSFGQVAALVASGVLSLEDAAVLVAERGTITAALGDEHPGAMVAILGLDLDLVEELAASAGVVIANDNAPGQVVIGGDPVSVDNCVTECRRHGAKAAVRLPIAAAFHTPLMEPARSPFRSVAERFEYKRASAPVILNDEPRQVFETDWPGHLSRMLVDRVRWRETVGIISASGVRALISFGPGDVLVGLAHRIDPRLEAVAVSRPNDLKVLADAVSSWSDNV